MGRRKATLVIKGVPCVLACAQGHVFQGATRFAGVPCPHLPPVPAGESDEACGLPLMISQPSPFVIVEEEGRPRVISDRALRIASVAAALFVGSAAVVVARSTRGWPQIVAVLVWISVCAVASSVALWTSR